MSKNHTIRYHPKQIVRQTIVYADGTMAIYTPDPLSGAMKVQYRQAANR